MTHLKSVMFGILASIAASVIWILVKLVFPLHAMFMFESVPGFNFKTIPEGAIFAELSELTGAALKQWAGAKWL